MIVECMHAYCKSCIVEHIYDQMKRRVPIQCPICDVNLHPTDPFSDIRFDQTLQDLTYMIVPNLFKKECRKRQEFCETHGIEFKLPRFKSKQGYKPGIEMINTKEESSTEEEEDEEDEVYKELENDAWIQCELEDCLKWRRVALSVAEEYEDEPWQCSFNADKNFNRCSIPEVNHLKYEKMAEAAGLTYVYSNMQEGTLVLAKLTGFTSWPAIICNDPVEGKFFETNEFGNPTKYHVEFLGKRHTQAWVESRSTVNYTGFPKEPLGKNGKQKKLPQALIDAYFEAEDLRNLSLEEKLEQCVLSRGLAKRLKKKGKEEKQRNYSRKRKRHSFSRTLSDSETDELLESLSFPDQPGEIEGEKN